MSTLIVARATSSFTIHRQQDSFGALLTMPNKCTKLSDDLVLLLDNKFVRSLKIKGMYNGASASSCVRPQQLVADIKDTKTPHSADGMSQ